VIRRGARLNAALLLVAGILAFAFAGCGALTVSPPVPGPESFPELSGQLGRLGVNISDWTSGDAGCDDPTLAPGGCRIFTKSGVVDGDLNVQIDRVVGDLLPKATAEAR